MALLPLNMAKSKTLKLCILVSMVTTLGDNYPKNILVYIKTSLSPFYGRYFASILYGCVRWHLMAILPQNMAKLKTFKLCIFVSMVTALWYNYPKNILEYIETRLCPLYGRYFVLFLYVCVRWHYILPQNMTKSKTLKFCIFVSMVTTLVYNYPKNICVYIETTLWPLYDMYFVLYLYGCVRWHYFLKIWLNQKHWNCAYLFPWLPPLDTITPRIFLCILKLDCVPFWVGISSYSYMDA